MKSFFNLIAQNITKEFRHNQHHTVVLKDITQIFKPEKSYAIMGPSGAGKSTFMHLLAGLDTPTSGSVLYGDSQLIDFAPYNRAQTVGLVLQNPCLIAELTVLENIALAGMVIGKTEKESAASAKELLQAVELEHAWNWHIGQLSGGQRQRIALARALLNKPAFLLADEVTGSLDAQTSIKLIQLLLRLQQEWKMGLILSTHNREVADMMELVFLLKDGNVVPMNDYYPERKPNESSSRA